MSKSGSIIVHPISFKGIARLLPTHIGGPGTLLPLIVELVLTWTLALSCLTVALWHYYADRYKTRIGSAFKSNRQEHRICLPLTTHSRREWATVSDYEGVKTRYKQLVQLIFSSIIAARTKVQNEEKKDEEDNSLDEAEYVIVDGETCPDNQSQKLKDRAFTKGEIVAEWLTSGFDASRKIQISTLTLPIKTSDRKGNDQHCHDSSEFLVQFLRTNEVARRLTSLLLGEDPISCDSSSTNIVSNTDTTKEIHMASKGAFLDRLSSEEPGAETVLQILRKLWPKLLELPAPLESIDGSDKAENISISIVVPAFREEGGQLATKLRASLKQAADPSRIEIVVVRVLEKDEHLNVSPSPFAKALREGLELTQGDCTDNKAKMSSMNLPVLRILDYNGGGGRGPCLNYGAKHARGSILTFLHADTRLATFGWDKAISKVLEGSGNGRQRITCCAFSFAIDTSPTALRVKQKKIDDCKHHNASNRDDSNCKQQYHPPGLRAIEVTANLRCKFFALPYGDQCLSLPTDIFRYLGGYPDQCLMEDYELIRLLRMRSASTQTWSNISSLDPDFCPREEAIEVLSEYKAICSPRRWQKYGVLYVTYTNSFCVKLYNNGKLTPDELFCRYYGTETPPNRMGGDRSPWESGLMSGRKKFRSIGEL